MTTATEIMMTARNANEAYARAEAESVDADQQWDNEATLYRFTDGSVLAINGGQVNAYADEDAAAVDFPN